MGSERRRLLSRLGAGKRRLLVVVAGLLCCIAIVQAIELRSAGPYNLTIGPRAAARTIWRSGLVDLRACACSPTETLSLGSSFRTRASLYGRAGSQPRPGVVLVHGNTALGRKLPLYRALATRLAARGFVVLVFDQIGFGESDDPFGRGPDLVQEVPRRETLVLEAVELLGSMPGVDAGRIGLIGHSGGSLPVLKAVLEARAAHPAALIGPPRRVRTRAADPEDSRYFQERFLRTREFVYGGPLPDWVTPDLLASSGPWALESYTPGIQEVLPRILFADGELESKEDLDYLERYQAGLPGPTRRLRLEGAGHYCNVSKQLGVVLYDAGVMDVLVQELASWFGDSWQAQGARAPR